MSVGRGRHAGKLAALSVKKIEEQMRLATLCNSLVIRPIHERNNAQKILGATVNTLHRTL